MLSRFYHTIGQSFFPQQTIQDKTLNSINDVRKDNSLNWFHFAICAPSNELFILSWFVRYKIIWTTSTIPSLGEIYHNVLNEFWQQPATHKNKFDQSDISHGCLVYSHADSFIAMHREIQEIIHQKSNMIWWTKIPTHTVKMVGCLWRSPCTLHECFVNKCPPRSGTQVKFKV